MTYEAKKYDHLLGTPGFSETMLKNHFTLYQGYVKNINLLHERFTELRTNDQFGSIEYAEIKRRSAWEWNGVRLHELYFGNMVNGGKALTAGSVLSEKLIAQYGSLEAWQKDFVATGSIRGIGWVVLVFDAEAGMFANTWVNEHDVGHRVGTNPLLIMDVFEHAYMTDYGIKRTDYISAFMAAIDWSVVEERFTHATK